ncbi:sensor histidine kinase [Agromyces sp. H3Y2-19a]|uniref:sensor histidine kinase n=1 Tax=Agromyces chromiiresistens TaxID=3030835 RepID=UPI0023B8F5BF|nr:sensor histidine kinase [Agromyces chromiiresistens]MDF0514022.1 sensor histidine kinase [Agromyces chromiiresistens]
MLNRRWWDAAAIAVAVVTVLFGLTDPPYGPPDYGAWAVAGVFLVVYFAYLRGRLDREDPTQHVVITIVLSAVVGVGVAFDPGASILQAFAYPFLWVTAPSTRRAIVANVGLAIALLVGYVVHFGWGGVVAGVAVAGLSLGFSLALGLWITHIAAIGEERARLLVELQSAQGQLAALHRDAGVSDERARLAREIHDTIAQSLTGLVMVAQRAGNRLDGSDDASQGTAAARADIELIEQMAREALTEARGLVATLAPVSADGGLTAALGRLGAAFERETGVRVAVDADASGLDRELEVVLLRSAQEGLANVRKHAGASRVAITVADRGAHEVVLTVCDDGAGPSPAAPGVSSPAPAGFGLAGLRDRAALVGGTLEFGPANGGGSLLRVTVPRKETA